MQRLEVRCGTTTIWVVRRQRLNVDKEIALLGVTVKQGPPAIPYERLVPIHVCMKCAAL